MYRPRLWALCFGCLFSDAMGTATWARREQVSKHCSKPLSTMGMDEDEASLLQADLKLHSKMHGQEDYTPSEDQKDEYGEDQYGKTSEYAYAKQKKGKHPYNYENDADRNSYGKTPNHVYAEKVDVKHGYSNGQGQTGRHRDSGYAKDRHDDYNSDSDGNYDSDHDGKNYDYDDSTAKDAYEDHYRSSKYDDGDDSKHTYNDCDGKDTSPQYNSKWREDYAYSKKRSDNYYDNYGEGRSDGDNWGKSRGYYREVKYDSDHSGMTDYSTPVEGGSTRYDEYPAENKHNDDYYSKTHVYWNSKEKAEDHELAGHGRYSNDHSYRTHDEAYVKEKKDAYGQYYGKGKYHDSQSGKTHDYTHANEGKGEYENYALLQVAGLKQAAGDVHSEMQHDVVDASSKEHTVANN